MAGRRNLAREQAEHAATLAARYQARLAQLRDQLPTHDRALIGRDAILHYLTDLGLRRPNRHPISWRMLKGWRLHRDFPMFPGAFVLGHRRRSPPMTTTHAVVAWLLCQQPLPHWCHLDLSPLTSATPKHTGRAPASRAA